jgi:signal transduction histidine kinase
LPVRDNWGWIIGNYYLTYPILIIGFWYFTLNKIYRSSKHCSSLDKINHLYMFWGLLLGIIPPVILNIILPFFNIYGASWTGPIFSSIWIFVIGFSIMRFQQMNVRLVIIEIIAIAMSALLFINIFINARIGRVETFILFVTFLSLSITLVKTVISEVKSKQQLKLLNETLDQKVKEQTAEISEAYEKELESRKTLEKLNITKNQFIMITQHGIRTPINSIKQQLNKIIKLIPKTKQKSANESLSQLDENVARLESINDDFVNLANSNSNEKILNLEKVEPLELIDNVIKEHNREIKQKKISVTINRNQNDWPSCFVDKNKLYNALSIFIENAVHYNKRMGQIIIDSKKNGDNLCIQIIDNGHGLTRDEVNKLNLNHFYRSEIAKEYNPNGMGVGINVGRAIIIAHHGSLKIDSLGPDAGVTIEINIPLNFINSLHIE